MNDGISHTDEQRVQKGAIVAKLWDRQCNEDGELEPRLWFGRFTDFRLQGAERTLLEANERVRDATGHRRTGNASGSWRRNAEKWEWRKRAEVWDEERRLARIAAEEQARAEMLKRHLQIAISLQRVGSKRLRQLDKIPRKLVPAEARRYLGDGVALEREARGMPNLATGEALVIVLKWPDEESEKHDVRT